MKIKMVGDTKIGEVTFIKDSLLDVDDVTAKQFIDDKSAIEYTPELEKSECETIKKIKEVNMSEDKEVKIEVKDEKMTLGMQLKELGKGNKKELTLKAPTGLNETTNADGGYLVTHGISQLWDFAQQGGIIAPKCQVLEVGANMNGMKLPYLDNSGAISRTSTPRGYWLAEGAQKTATKLAFGQHDLSLGKLCFYVPFSDEILEDVTYLESYVNNYIKGARIGWMVDDAILNLATTTSGMMGVFDAAAANFRVQSGTHADPWTADIVWQVVSGVMPTLRGGSEWYMSNSTWQHIIGDLGAGTTVSTVALVDQQLKTLGGYPVNVMEQMAAFGGSANGSVLFGNFAAGYKLIKKGDVKVDVSTSIRFDYDETVFRFVLRVAGAPIVREQTLPDNTVVAAFAST